MQSPYEVCAECDHALQLLAVVEVALGVHEVEEPVLTDLEDDVVLGVRIGRDVRHGHILRLAEVLRST